MLRDIFYSRATIMNKLINFILSICANFKDKNYRNILLFVVTSGIVVQSLLLPSLDYVALNIKHSNRLFYSYAAIATIAASLPQALSFINSYLVNNMSFKYILVFGGATILVSGLFMLGLYQHFILYVVWVILCGIVVNAIYLNLSRQICTVLANKIKEYNTDVFLFSSIVN